MVRGVAAPRPRSAPAHSSAWLDLIQEARLNDVSQVNIVGAASVTSGAVQALCEHERPIAYFTMGGWFYAMTSGLSLKNVFLRRDQFRRADDE